MLNPVEGEQPASENEPKPKVLHAETSGQLPAMRIPLDGREVGSGHVNPHTSNWQQDPSTGMDSPMIASNSAFIWELAMQSAAARAGTMDRIRTHQPALGLSERCCFIVVALRRSCS
jgi:hypothetical protein